MYKYKTMKPNNFIVFLLLNLLHHLSHLHHHHGHHHCSHATSTSSHHHWHHHHHGHHACHVSFPRHHHGHHHHHHHGHHLVVPCTYRGRVDHVGPLITRHRMTLMGVGGAAHTFRHLKLAFCQRQGSYDEGDGG